MYLITSFLYFISSALDDELSALDFWYFCRRGDSTFTNCPLLYSFFTRYVELNIPSIHDL